MKTPVINDGLTVDQVIAEVQRLCFSPTDPTNIVLVRRGDGLSIELATSVEAAEAMLERHSCELREERIHLENTVSALSKEAKACVADINRYRAILRNIKRHQIKPRLP